MPSTEPTIIDLFCGCGGLGLGAELAGFRSLAAIDKDADLQSAYRLNFPKTQVIQGDISLLDKASWKQILGTRKPDGIIGGPPCQGFSRIGRKLPNDPRNSLVGHFFKQIDNLRPKFFVMENVEGILDAGSKEVLDAALNTLPPNYTVVGPVRINALDCGAATSRKRVVVVGFDPEHIDSIDLDILSSGIRLPPTNVRDAISDLPPPTGHNVSMEGGFAWSKYPDHDNSSSSYAQLSKVMPPEGLGCALALSKLANGEVTGLMPTKHTQAVIERFAETVQGKIEAISRYPRLNLDGYCPTLRAGTGSDKGSYQAMRPIHPVEPRVITVREAARLQGFPDWFLFHPTIWHSFRMIGNSVSPMMSRQILSAIRKKMI
jgi:DNA (cytosine-5)-methyltransferase 1